MSESADQIWPSPGQTDSEDGDGAPVLPLGRLALPISPMVKVNPGLTIHRLLAPPERIAPRRATVENHLARMFGGDGLTFLAGAARDREASRPLGPSSSAASNDAPPAMMLPPPLRSADSPFVFARYRRRAVAPAPAAPSPASAPAATVDPMAPTAARERAAAADPSRPLPEDQRAAFEPVVGADLSGVRIHTGVRAMATAAALRAEAFTIGKDIFFQQGRFQPATEHGQALLAHELVHVRQEAEDAGDGTPEPRGDREATEAQAEAAERLVRANRQSQSGGQLTVGRLVRHYLTSSGRPIARSDRERLDAVSLRALIVCERLLGPTLSRIAEHEIDGIQINLTLDLARLSDEQVAEIWGRALVDAVRQKTRL